KLASRLLGFALLHPTYKIASPSLTSNPASGAEPYLNCATQRARIKKLRPLERRSELRFASVVESPSCYIKQWEGGVPYALFVSGILYRFSRPSITSRVIEKLLPGSCSGRSNMMSS